jgi:hypothetical protein
MTHIIIHTSKKFLRNYYSNEGSYQTKIISYIKLERDALK